MFNSNGNTNSNTRGLFPVASIPLWLCNNILHKGRIETNYVLSLEIVLLRNQPLFKSMKNSDKTKADAGFC